MKTSYKKYGIGGVAQSFGSPMIESGMQTVTGNWGGSPVSVFAKGGYTKRISDNDLYRFREKTKHERIDTEGVGNFELPKDKDTRYLYELNDFDKNLVKDIKLKPNEHIFRYETYSTKIGGYIPLVKINLDNQMVYFLTENAWDGGDIEFVKKGEKAQFINISDKYANGGKMNDGGEFEDKNQYDFSIRFFKDNLDVLNDDYEYEEFRGTKNNVIKKVNDSLTKGKMVYAYVRIENIVTDWYYESGDLERMRMEVNRYGENEYAKGGQIPSVGDSGVITDKNSMFVGKMALITGDLGNMFEVRVGERTTIVKKNGIRLISDEYAQGGMFEVGDWVAEKKGTARGQVYKKLGSFIYLKDKYGNESQTLYSEDKFKKSATPRYDDGGQAKISIANTDIKFDKSLYKGILDDYDLDGLPNADDPNPYSKKDKVSLEQTKLSTAVNNVINVKNKMDDELDVFVKKLQQVAPSDSKIYGRTKTPFSILNKLVNSRLLDQKRGLKDLVGTTVAFGNYQDLQNFKKRVDKGMFGKVVDFDDYYENPNDGYRAYHYIVEQDGTPIELQLKTDRMKEINVLSHDAYKNQILNKDYLLYLTTIANDADKGNTHSMEQFSEIMSKKVAVKKKLSSGK